jgi:hypothetical protein
LHALLHAHQLLALHLLLLRLLRLGLLGRERGRGERQGEHDEWVSHDILRRSIVQHCGGLAPT